MKAGRSHANATYAVVRAPISSCPCAPMLKSPARKASETDSPARINGVMITIVSLRPEIEPSELLKSA